MSWASRYLGLPRVPEPEVMDDSSEVQAYSSAAAEAHLGKIDDSFVEHALRLVDSAPGLALDIGCGPGEILLKISTRLSEWKFVGVDRSLAMLRLAQKNRESQTSRRLPSAAATLCYLTGDAGSLPFRNASFDLVLCNSVLHHVSDPSRLFSEIRRVAKPGAAILVRDLRRPSRIRFPFHVRWHGRHYDGLMYKLFCDSVRAAYTPEELSAMLNGAGIPGASMFVHGATHLGIERRARPAN
jgi:ubiquinone/menaquinone biosynthesis C-methylase UbiE